MRILDNFRDFSAIACSSVHIASLVARHWLFQSLHPAFNAFNSQRNTCFSTKKQKTKKKNVALMSLVSCSICVAPGALCVRCVEENLLQEHYEDDKEKNTSIGYFDQLFKNIHPLDHATAKKRVRPERQEKEISRD